MRFRAGLIGLSCVALMISQTVSAGQQRVITLAPHLAELVDAVGAIDTLVGVSRHSDHPLAVRDLPSVGDAFQFNEEQMLMLRPTLVLAWGDGTPVAEVQRLRSLGLTVEVIHVQRLDDVAAAMRRIGGLLGRASQADLAADAFEARIKSLRVDSPTSVAVFYQISESPLYTLSDAHVASDVIRLCGGRNVFADAPVIAPQVSRESVLAAQPDVLIYSGATGDQPWRRLRSIPAVSNKQMYRVPADWLTRPGPRLVLGAEAVCTHLSGVRSARFAPADSHPGTGGAQ